MVEDVEDALMFLQAGAAERWGLDIMMDPSS
jgi:hypothetical protein